MSDKDTELHDILKEHLEPKFQEFFNQGLMAGYDACIENINREIAPMTSAKTIKDLLRAKRAETDKRLKARGATNE